MYFHGVRRGRCHRREGSSRRRTGPGPVGRSTPGSPKGGVNVAAVIGGAHPTCAETEEGSGAGDPCGSNSDCCGGYECNSTGTRQEKAGRRRNPPLMLRGPRSPTARRGIPVGCVEPAPGALRWDPAPRRGGSTEYKRCGGSRRIIARPCQGRRIPAAVSRGGSGRSRTKTETRRRAGHPVPSARGATRVPGEPVAPRSAVVRD